MATPLLPDGFMREENERRRPTFAKDPHDEDFVRHLCGTLGPLEDALCRKPEGDAPSVFILGLPRSGTTLLYQILANSLDVAWPTNLMARFWGAPAVGMRLSRVLGLFDQPVELRSEHGVTNGAHSPHEFGYFWLNWLRYDDVLHKGDLHERMIDWKGLTRKLRSICAQAGKPVLYKNLLYAYHLEAFARATPESLFVLCQREPADVAVSILRTRRERYGDEREWWSVRPPDCGGLMAEDAYTQIANQVGWFSALLGDGVRALPSHCVRRVRIERINDELDLLAEWLSDALRVCRKPFKLPEIRVPSHADDADYARFLPLLDDVVRSAGTADPEHNTS